MVADRRQIASVLLWLISSLLACVQLNVALLNAELSWILEWIRSESEYVWTGEFDMNTLWSHNVWTRIFSYPERKSCGFKNIRIRVDGALVWPYINSVIWQMIAVSVATLKLFSPESEISLRKKQKKSFCGKFGSIPIFINTRKGTKCFCDEPTSVWPQGLAQHRIFIKFFRFRSISLVFRTFKLIEFKEFNKTIIPFALVGHEAGYHVISNARSWNNC